MENHGMALLKTVNIYYSPIENRFYTEDGQVIYAMNWLVSPARRDTFKAEKRSMSYVIPSYSLEVNLFYPTGAIFTVDEKTKYTY